MYERQYTRIDTIRTVLDEMLNGLPDPEVRRCGFVHLYGVGQACALIALHRGFTRSDAELLEIAGMLHDYAKYKYDVEEDHAQKSSEEAECILMESNVFSEEETRKICHAISMHSLK